MADVKIPEDVYLLVVKALLYDDSLSEDEKFRLKRALLEKENKRTERAEHVSNYKWLRKWAEDDIKKAKDWS